MVNAGREVWVDRGGDDAPRRPSATGAIGVVLERVLAPTGRRIDRTNPIVDVRLASGARLCAVDRADQRRRHRCRRSGSTDRASSRSKQFVEQPGAVALLDEVIAARCNVLDLGCDLIREDDVRGGPARTRRCIGSTRHLRGHHRTVTVRRPRRAARGARRRRRWLPPVDLAALVRAALRLRPDRLVVGEFRGTEVLAAIEAMNTGHDGSMSTCHANSAVDALRRVETLLMQAAPAWPLAAIRRQVSVARSTSSSISSARPGRRRVCRGRRGP